MMTHKNESLWDVESLYEFQYFHCPACSYNYNSKQDFVCHTYDTHPESIDYFRKISDGSLSDILPPWGFNDEKSEIIHNDNDIIDDNNVSKFEDEEGIPNHIYIKTENQIDIYSNDSFDLQNAKSIKKEDEQKYL